VLLACPVADDVEDVDGAPPVLPLVVAPLDAVVFADVDAEDAPPVPPTGSRQADQHARLKPMVSALRSFMHFYVHRRGSGCHEKNRGTDAVARSV
jgi:hypothetical protein